MKKRGFTLIELLAVIVVLAIIALIATPIVMNVIKNAQMGAAERSADNYVKAVEILIATKQLDGEKMADGEYEISSTGKLIIDGKEYEVEVSGTKPNGGTIKIENGQVNKNTSTINYKDYTVTYQDGKAQATEFVSILCTVTENVTMGNIAHGSYSFGDEYVCKVNKKESYNFMIVDSNDDYVYMMATGKYNWQWESIFGSTPWATKADFILAGGSEALWNADVSLYPESKGKYTYGPVTALKYLDRITEDWDYISNINEEYTDKFGHYTINLTGKARFLTYDDAYALYYFYNNGYYIGTGIMDTVPSSIVTDESRVDWGYDFGDVYDYGDGIACGDCLYYSPEDSLGIFPVIKVHKDKIAGPAIPSLALSDICELTSGSENTVGAKYACDLGTETRNFYVLNEGNSKRPVTLILEENYDATTQTWCDQNGSYPNSNKCNADGLKTKMDEISNAWTKLDQSQIALPTNSHLTTAQGKDAYGAITLSWLSGNYWLTKGVRNGDDRVDQMFCNSKNQCWITEALVTDNSAGIRPVITLALG